jgi:hypothetical protein
MMVIRSIEQWQALFKQHDESGLKASEFCRANKLCPRYFSKRKRDLACHPKDNPAVVKKPKLVKIKKEKQINRTLLVHITLQMKDISIDIPVSQSSQWVANLVKALSA